MARPKLGKSETERLHVKITADEIRAIDDWRFANRMPSRSETVRRLVQIALAFDKKADALHAAMSEMSTELAARADRMMKVAELPAENDPPWLASYVIETGGFAQAAFEHLLELSDIAKTIDAKRHFMKLGEESFESAVAGAIAYEAGAMAEKLQERIEEFERSRSEGEK